MNQARAIIDTWAEKRSPTNLYRSINYWTTSLPMSPDGRRNELTAVTITVDSTESFKRRVKAAFSGKQQDERISFESFDLLWKVLAPNRMTLVKTLTGAGPVTLRELARRLERDVRAVHSDVHLLLDAGVLRKDERGLIEFPYTAVHVDFMLKTAA